MLASGLHSPKSASNDRAGRWWGGAGAAAGEPSGRRGARFAGLLLPPARLCDHAGANPRGRHRRLSRAGYHPVRSHSLAGILPSTGGFERPFALRAGLASRRCILSSRTCGRRWTCCTASSAPARGTRRRSNSQFPPLSFADSPQIPAILCQLSAILTSNSCGQMRKRQRVT